MKLNKQSTIKKTLFLLCLVLFSGSAFIKTNAQTLADTLKMSYEFFPGYPYGDDYMIQFWPPSTDITLSGSTNFFETPNYYDFECGFDDNVVEITDWSGSFTLGPNGARLFAGKHTVKIKVEKFIPSNPDSTYFIKIMCVEPLEFRNNTQIIGTTYNYLVPFFNIKDYLIIDSVQWVPGQIEYEIPLTILPLPEAYNNGVAAIRVFLHYNHYYQYDLLMFSNWYTYSCKYVPPSLQFEGLLDLNINAGTKHVKCSYDGGYSWKPYNVPASKSEIYNLNEVGVIYIKQPYSTSYDAIQLNENNGGMPQINRAIYLPKVSDAILSNTNKVVYVKSTENFVFKITPTGANLGKTLVVTTDRSIPDSKGVMIVDNKDGSFTVTILRVQSEIHVNIDFDIILSNELTHTTKVWSANGFLYITPTNTGEAKVFDTNGIQIRSFTLSAGKNEIIPLPVGLYVVSLEGESYKIRIK